MTNIILCGGSGKRLWPLSTEKFPKQFCRIAGNKSLFQETLLRNSGICEKIIIIANVKHFNLAKKQAEEICIKNAEYILEPVGRNTAPAITIACMTLNKEEIVFVTPSDHFIQDKTNYKKMVKNAAALAKKNSLVTFGIKPSSADTGFGYIKADGENVLSFHEKPNLQTAKKYVNEGNYFWNSGMFAFKAGVLIEDVKTHSLEIYKTSLAALKNIKTKNKVSKIDKKYMQQIPALSIDYAVMEKSRNIKMIQADIPWSDLGSFEAIYKISKKDKNKNSLPLSVKSLNANNNLVITNKKNIALIDVQDLIVIETEDSILISKMGSSQKIKDLL